VPYYRKRPELIERYAPGTAGAYARNWPGSRRGCDRMRQDYLSGRKAIPTARSHEYASDIIEGHVFNRQKLVHASVPNTGLIPNLPQTGVVEVAVLVDRRGFTPTYFGPLPEQVAALCRSNMAVYELCVQGVMCQERETVIRAMMLDPLSAAVCSLQEIRALAEELFRAERDFIPAWCQKPRRVKPLPLPARPSHGVDAFYLLGPFKNADRKGRPLGLTQALPPEERVDLKARYTGKGGRTIRWKKIGPEQISWQGFIDLLKHCGDVQNAVAYAYTVLESKRDMEITLQAGSDDGLAVWLNGENVYRIEAMRGAWPGQDTIPLKLHQGRNELLLKIDQKAGDWGFYLDIKDRPRDVRVRLP
jgi:hypothetical protein